MSHHKLTPSPSRGVLALVWILLGASSFVQARIGESEQACEARYGPGREDKMAVAPMFQLLEGARHRVFEMNGWSIHIAFVNGLAVREQYYKPVSAGGPKFNVHDLETILTAEKGAWTWQARPTPNLLSTVFDQNAAKAMSMGKVWERKDGALAMLLPGDVIVRVELAQASVLEEKLKQEKEKKQRQSIPKF